MTSTCASPAGPIGAERIAPAALRLAQAAQALVAEGAIDSATVEDVIERAQVSKRSFYNHFADRDALARQVLAEAAEALHAHLLHLSAAAADPAERFVRLTLGCVANCSADRFREQALARSVHDAKDWDVPGLAPLLEAFAAAIAAGALTPASPDAGRALLLGTCLMGSSHLQRLGDDRGKARALAHELALLMLRGLRADKRRQARLVTQAVDLMWPTPQAARAT